MKRRRKNKRAKAIANRNVEMVTMAKNGASETQIANTYQMSISSVHGILAKSEEVIDGDFHGLNRTCINALKRNGITTKEQLLNGLSSEDGIYLKGIGNTFANEIENLLNVKLQRTLDRYHNRLTLKIIPNTETSPEESIEELLKKKEELEKRIENMKGVTCAALRVRPLGEGYVAEIKVKQDDEIKAIPFIYATTATGIDNQLESLKNDIQTLQFKVFTKWGKAEHDAAEGVTV